MSRPFGTHNKSTLAIKALAQQACSPAYWRRIRRQMEDGTLNPKVECTILAYAYGLPTKEVFHSGTVVHVGMLADMLPALPALDVSPQPHDEVSELAEEVKATVDDSDEERIARAHAFLHGLDDSPETESA